MEYAEYWLLNAVVKLMYPLELLVAEDVEAIFNRPSHGLPSTQLISTLHRLFQEGKLVTRRMEGLDLGSPFVPDLSEVQAALAGKRELYYGLTFQGGITWEAISKPDWQLFIDVSYGTDEGEIIASDSQLIEQYMSVQHYKWHNIIVPKTEVRDVVAPWQATYWKTLPLGHRVRFRYIVQEETVYEETPLAVQAWFLHLDTWYTNPFEQVA